jgi:hypothetical protein
MAKKIIKFTPGIVPDPRSQAEKDKDYRHEELALAGPFTWVEKAKSTWRQYPMFVQDGSGSCLAQAVAKALGIERLLKSGRFVFYTPRWIYTLRANLSMIGMYLVDAMGIPCKVGIPTEQLMPSQNLSEAKMNDISDVTDYVRAEALISKTEKFITVTPNIDTIASIIEPNGKPVVLTTKFAMEEWNQEVPTVNPAADPTLGHGICAVEATLYNGQKALIIDDSWGTGYGIGGKRIITEAWFKANRVTGAGYFTQFANAGSAEKPIHTFTKQLQSGLKVDPEVVWLQKCLNYLGYFPDVQEFTGNFYGLTTAAVKTFQANYGISNTGIVGPITMAKLNELFSK